MHKSKRNNGIRWEVYLLGIFIVLLPFVVYFHQEMLTSEGQRVFAATDGVVTDFFLYYKEWLLLGVAGILTFSCLADWLTKSGRIPTDALRTKNAKVILVFAAGSAICIVLSAVRACVEGRTDTIWMGINTEGEGVLTLLSYLILFLAGYLYFRDESAKRFIKRCLVILMTLLSVLAIVECFTGGIYALPFMKYLIAPEEYRALIEGLKSTMAGKVSLGCYNPGYFGGLCALLFPVAVGMTYCAKRWLMRVGGALLSAGLLAAQFAAGTTGPVYATVVGVVLLLIVLRREPKKALLTVGMIVVCLFVGGIFGNVLSGGKLMKHMAHVLGNIETVEHSEQQFVVSSMKLDNGILEIKGKEHMFYIDAPKGENSTLDTLEIYDKDGQELASEEKDGKRCLTETGFEGVRLSNEEGMLLLELGYEEGIWFYVTDQGIRLAGQNGVRLDSIPQPAVTGLEKFYGVATGRGYTWVQSLPILKKCILLGEGAGNFVYLFRQNEVAGLLNTHGSSQFVIDKPHNWYIQMAVNNGMIAVILFVVLLCVLAKRSCFKYVVPKNIEQKDIFGATVLIGVAVFAITGLVNDSIVAVNPIFWLLCGIGCAEVE